MLLPWGQFTDRIWDWLRLGTILGCKLYLLLCLVCLCHGWPLASISLVCSYAGLTLSWVTIGIKKIACMQNIIFCNIIWICLVWLHCWWPLTLESFVCKLYFTLRYYSGYISTFDFAWSDSFWVAISISTAIYLIDYFNLKVVPVLCYSCKWRREEFGHLRGIC